MGFLMFPLSKGLEWASLILGSFVNDYNKISVHEVTIPMSTLEQIESAILSLPTQEFQRLREWLLELDQQHWDQQLEQDIADGKLDALAAEAIAEFEAGECRAI
jgi:hypothetical protein